MERTESEKELKKRNEKKNVATQAKTFLLRQNICTMEVLGRQRMKSQTSNNITCMGFTVQHIVGSILFEFICWLYKEIIVLNEFSKYKDFFQVIAELSVLRNYFSKIIVNLGIKCVQYILRILNKSGKMLTMQVEKAISSKMQ